VTIEPTNVPREGAGPVLEHRPDIRFTLEGVTRFLDVAIVDPAARLHLDYAAAPSATTPGGAAVHEEAIKRQLYANTQFADSLIPFVLESTGRLGQSARDFLEAFGNATPPSRRSALLTDISSILALKLGEMSSLLRNRLRGVRRRPP